jgi:RimJ/RimL family protein N-acetyltransferase
VLRQESPVSEHDLQLELDQPVINIVGQKVALGPPRRELLPLYLKWVNDFEVTRTTATGMRPMTWEAEESWYDRLTENQQEVSFTIYDRATLQPIGNTGLIQVDYIDRSAEFGIMIGEKAFWGKGYGTETTVLMLDYGFNGLGLHNIMLRVFSNNQRGLRAYQRAGFRLIGRRREARRLGGRPHDVIYMDCLASEFQSPLLQRLVEDSA